MGQDLCKPQPGDLIEIFRPGYQHWALYVGNGFVIHLTAADEGSSSILLSSSSIGATRAKVKKERLKVVVGRHGWRVNNKYDRKRTPRPVNEIIQEAEERIGEELPYNALTSNCEHFVTELRYGKGVSKQVKKAIGGTIGGIAAAVALAPVAAAFPVVTAIAAAPIALFAGVSAAVRKAVFKRKLKRLQY